MHIVARVRNSRLWARTTLVCQLCRVAAHDDVQCSERRLPQGTMGFTQEGAQLVDDQLEDGTARRGGRKRDVKLGGSDQGKCLHSRHAGDLVSHALEEQRQDRWQHHGAVVSKVCDKEAHARDGALLHL